MKKIARLTGLLIATLFITNCAENLEFSNPSIQGHKNGNVWRAEYYSADIDGNKFVIEGGDNYSTITLITANDAVGTYNLGPESQSEARFTDENGNVFSTLNEPDPSMTVYPAEGEIVVEDVENTTPKTITGNFWFNAYTADGLQVVNFSQGVFYKVPLTGGIDVGVECGDAVTATAVAQENYEAASEEDENYTDLCNAYKTALEAQIAACGDEGDVLQAIVDGLDCEDEQAVAGELTYDGETYELTAAWVYDEDTQTNEPSEIGINLYNKTFEEIESGEDLTGVTHIYFDFDDIEVQETTYTEITDYDVSIDGTFTNGEFIPGTILLDDADANNYATSTTVTINSVTESTIDLTFSFTRADGIEISGNYAGEYMVP